MIESLDIHAAVLAHVQQEYEDGKKEACGLLLETAAGLHYWPCRNIAKNPQQEFRINPRDRLDAEQAGKVIALVHSHPDDSSRPSAADLTACSRGTVPWVIVGWPSADHRTVMPASAKLPYEGRQFLHGSVDCYTLVQDYYLHELGIALPEVEREDRWWERGVSLYVANLETAGFVRVDTPEKHDGVLMCIGAEVPNHAGIYLGNDMLLHHMYGKLSRKTTFGGTYWYDHLYGYYRHKSRL